MSKMRTVWAIYDARYTTDPNEAVQYSEAPTLKQARKERDEDYPDGVIVKQDMISEGGNTWKVARSTIQS